MRNSLRVTLSVAFCVACGLAATAAAVGGANADSFRAEAEGTGTAVLHFLGQDVTADVRAKITLSGTLIVDGVPMSFTVVADANGSGSGNLDTLAVDAWVAVAGQGTTESGVSVTIQGGISVDALDPATTSAGGQGSGHFYFLIATPDGRWAVEGDAVGSASGDFVVPDDPSTMKVAGTGSFALSGDLRPWNPAESGTLPAWPAKLLEELARQAANASKEAGK
jgi:hypothetical protein